MAQYDTTQASLVRTYDRSNLFEPCEREERRFWDAMQMAPKTELLGSGFYFDIIGFMGHGVGNPAEGGDYSVARLRNDTQCVVNGARVDSVVSVSDDFIHAAKGDGSFAGNATKDSQLIAETTRQILEYANVLVSAGSANGRLAEVEGAVSTSATVVLAWPKGAYQLRPGQYIDVVSAGGTDAEATGVRILDVDYVTPQITVSTTTNLTDGAFIYNSAGFGKTFPNGTGNIIDDGDEASTLYGVTRSSNTFMNAYSYDGSGALDDFSEAEVDKFLDQVTYRTGNKFAPTRLRSNKGLLARAKALFTKDRIFMLTGSEVPKGVGGMNQEKMKFIYGDRTLEWMGDTNLPARNLYAEWTPGYRIHWLRKLDWYREEGGPIFSKAIASTTAQHYAYGWVGAMLMNFNISHRRPNANGLRKNFKDPNVSGDIT